MPPCPVDQQHQQLVAPGSAQRANSASAASIQSVSAEGRISSRFRPLAGWNVIITGRRADRLDKLRQELGAERVHASVFDIRDAGAIDAALGAMAETG